MTDRSALHGDVLDEQMRLTLADLCRLCRVEEHVVLEMVHEGVVEVASTRHEQWIFSGAAVARIRTAVRLQQDLDVNLPGAALALELIDEIERLRGRVR